MAARLQQLSNPALRPEEYLMPVKLSAKGSRSGAHTGPIAEKIQHGALDHLGGVNNRNWRLQRAELVVGR